MTTQDSAAPPAADTSVAGVEGGLTPAAPPAAGQRFYGFNPISNTTLVYEVREVKE